jgi:TonB family protein
MPNLRAPLVLSWLLLAHAGLPQTASPTGRDPASATDQVRLSEILISTPQPYDPAQVADARQRAEQARAAIGRNGAFADIARDDSQGPTAAQGGDVGCFHHGDLAKALDELVFRMQVGDVSDVLRTKQGFVILEVSDRGTDACADLQLLNQPITSDLRRYLKTQERKLRQRWYRLIPESAQMKQGNVTIEFSIQRNGAVTDQKVASGSGDIHLDRAALNAIFQASPFSPLPSTTKMDHLRLRFNFQYNPAKIKGS